MKATINIARVSPGVSAIMSDPVNLPAPPWGSLDACDRSETAPRIKRLAPAKPTRAEIAIAAIRDEWRTA